MPKADAAHEVPEPRRLVVLAPHRAQVATLTAVVAVAGLAIAAVASAAAAAIATARYAWESESSRSTTS